MGGRHDQHRCHFLVKALQCWWAAAAATYQHWPGDISFQITLTAATTSSQWGKAAGQTDRRGD